MTKQSCECTDPECKHMSTLPFWRPGVGATSLDGPSNYIGAHFGAWHFVPGLFTHRDADCLTRSNWAIVTKAIKAASTAPDDETFPFENETNNWACGWTACLLIHPSDSGAIAEALRWVAKLDIYPVANEEHYSDLEWSEACEYWKRASVRERAQLIQESGSDASIFAARRDTIPEESNSALWETLTRS